MNRLQTLEKRAAALLPAPPWTFEQFRAAWASMDALSRSIYETMAATPELFPGEDTALIADYLRRLGVDVEPQPFPEELEGDTA